MGHDFPKFSISIYDSFDGSEFFHPRQQINGKQILSTIVSDDYFPINSDDSNYLNGISSDSFLFYAKIIIFSSLPDTNPSSYMFKKTYNGDTELCIMNLISQKTDYSLYWSSFSIPSSDYVSKLDGNIFFTVVAKELDIEVSIPVIIECLNSGIVVGFNIEPDSPTQLNASNLSVYGEYFASSFLLSQLNYSVLDYNTNSLGLGYNQTSQNNPSVVFDPTQAFYNFYGSLFELQINFLKDNFLFSVDFFESDICYFGCTLLTNDGLLSLADAFLNLYLKTVSGKIYNVEPRVILQNKINSLACNFIFEFSGDTAIGSILLPNDSISEATLRIDLNTFPSSGSLFTTLTYFNFLQNNQSSEFKILSNSKNLYVVDVLGNSQNYFEIFKHLPLISENSYCLAESYLEIESDASYKLKTKNFEINLDEFMIVSTNVGFIPVSSLTSQHFIKTIEGFENVESIVVFSGEKTLILDTFGQNSYYLNGILVKNPFYIKKFVRSFIPALNSKALQYDKSVEVNGKDYFAINHNSLSIFQINKKIMADQICNIQINCKFDKIAILFDSTSIVYYKIEKINSETNQNIIIAEKFSGKITLRSREDLVIKTMYLT